MFGNPPSKFLEVLLICNLCDDEVLFTILTLYGSQKAVFCRVGFAASVPNFNTWKDFIM
jgi:hypothetical protein